MTAKTPFPEEGPDKSGDALAARKQLSLETARLSLEKQGFDAIVLLATYVDEAGSTRTLSANYGNWHAQNGLTEHFRHKRRRDCEMDAEDFRRGDDD